MKSNITCAILGLLLIFLLGAAPASAASFGLAEEEAWVQAQSYWGGSTPQNCSSITKEMVPPGSLDGDDNPGKAIAGRATQPEPGSSIKCTIAIIEGMSVCALRAVMAHEYGHLLGYGHTSTPNGIMNGEGSNIFCITELALNEVTEFQLRMDIKRQQCPKYKSRLVRKNCWRIFRNLRNLRNSAQVRALTPILP